MVVVRAHMYVTDGQNKKNKLCTLFQKLVQRVVKKGSLIMRIYYIIPVNDRLTEHPENFKIKLYCFQERLSRWYNIIVKLLSVSNMYDLHYIYWNNKIKMSRRNALCMDDFNGRRRVPENCSLKIDVPNFWKYEEI